MDLGIKDKLFVVTGATSGFGKAIFESLVAEDAHVIINARGEERLIELQKLNKGKIEIVAGDITTDATLSELIRKIGDRKLDGIVVNASGPPAATFQHTDLGDWDDAYALLLRWKVKLTKLILPLMIKNHYGRILFIESISVKQPIENLVLSNSLRMAVVGFMKTLSQEVAQDGITCNILAPGYHSTPAMERLYINKSNLLGINADEARAIFEKEVSVGRLGQTEEFASLATWLLSSLSGYITGQTISVDGGLVKGSMG
ncbi:SDR family oxidoreductase [Portibacter lacus]|uniref:3-oxoacyl-ACP reductase n=1 Tax=Portibacter lacus TaxID=1099794 RepID=A0AA37WGH2_9BACT|nr:SDR family oxidoreductase [Portibacter lacus]GLR18359.1 3-oxoacyl-ACP reductase [Portibacter lacus]